MRCQADAGAAYSERKSHDALATHQAHRNGYRNRHRASSKAAMKRASKKPPLPHQQSRIVREFAKYIAEAQAENPPALAPIRVTWWGYKGGDKAQAKLRDAYLARTAPGIFFTAWYDPKQQRVVRKRLGEIPPEHQAYAAAKVAEQQARDQAESKPAAAA